MNLGGGLLSLCFLVTPIQGWESLRLSFPIACTVLL